jgi:hypothetical protein
MGRILTVSLYRVRKGRAAELQGRPAQNRGA